MGLHRWRSVMFINDLRECERRGGVNDGRSCRVRVPSAALRACESRWRQGAQDGDEILMTLQLASDCALPS